MLSRSVAFRASARTLWSEDRGDHGPQLFSNSRIPRAFYASLQYFRTFAVSKDKGFEFYQKIIEFGPPNLRYHDAPEQVMCSIRPREIFLNM